jgi:hypothetical protein
VHNLGNESKRLQRTRSESFDKQQGSKFTQLLVVRHREHGPKTFEIDILPANVMMSGHREFSEFRKS